MTQQLVGWPIPRRQGSGSSAYQPRLGHSSLATIPDLRALWASSRFALAPHRLSTLRKADRLVVLERGRVVEVGNHDALIEKDGVYARLYEAQTRQQAEAEA